MRKWLTLAGLLGATFLFLGYGVAHAGFQVDSSGTLTTNLVSYYKLDDVSDSFGSYGLTNSSSLVVFNTGKIGNSADFGANNSTKYLSIGNNLGITGGNFSMSLWFNVTTAPGSGATYILANQVDLGTNTGYLIWYQNNGGTKQIKWRRLRQGTANDDVTYILHKAALALRDLKGGHAGEERAHTTPASLLIEGGVLLGRF
jgi:hypothetical protein